MHLCTVGIRLLILPLVPSYLNRIMQPNLTFARVNQIYSGKYQAVQKLPRSLRVYAMHGFGITGFLQNTLEMDMSEFQCVCIHAYTYASQSIIVTTTLH